MGQRPPPSEVHKEWEAIAFSNGGFSSHSEDYLLDLELESWKPLYERCYAHGEWKVPLDDARLVASMGMSHYLMVGEFRESIEVGERFFRHPETEKLNVVERNAMLYWFTNAQLHAGDIEEGCRSLGAILETKGYGASGRLRQIVWTLASYAEAAGPEAPIPGVVHDFALNALRRWKGLTRRIERLSRATTMGEMQSILETIQP